MSTDNIVINCPAVVELRDEVESFMDFFNIVSISATRNAIAAHISAAQPCCMVNDINIVSRESKTGKDHGGHPVNKPSTKPFSRYRRIARISSGWRVYVKQYPKIHTMHHNHSEPNAVHKERNKYHKGVHFKRSFVEFS